MKKIVVLSLLVVFGCKESIKNEKPVFAENTLEEIQFVEPKVTDSKTVNSIDDLMGYWVGDFEADILESQIDSLYAANQANLIRRKITVSFDKIKGDSIFGHSVVAGNISAFKGVFDKSTQAFDVEIEELSKTKYDGSFKMKIVQKDSLLKGNWIAYSPEQLKIGKRKYSLKKKKFVYNANNLLEFPFRNTDKFKKLKVPDAVDKEIEEYQDEEYLSTTDKIFEVNASKKALTVDFVSNLTKADISILRNSIFARHGFAFRSKQLRMYFEDYEWYMPVFGDVKDDLTTIEKKNIALLMRYEAYAEEYYDTFGR